MPDPGKSWAACVWPGGFPLPGAILAQHGGRLLRIEWVALPLRGLVCGCVYLVAFIPSHPFPVRGWLLRPLMKSRPAACVCSRAPAIASPFVRSCSLSPPVATATAHGLAHSRLDADPFRGLFSNLSQPPGLAIGGPKAATSLGYSTPAPAANRFRVRRARRSPTTAGLLCSCQAARGYITRPHLGGRARFLVASVRSYVVQRATSHTAPPSSVRVAYTLWPCLIS